MLEGWPSAYGSVNIVSLSPEPRPDSKGKMSLKIDGSEEPGTGGLFSEMIPIVPEKPLQITGWIRERDVPLEKSAKPYIGVAWYDQDKQPIILREGTTVNYRYIPYPQVDDWQEIRCTIEPSSDDQSIPKDAAYCQLRLFVIEYAGIVWLDDFDIRQEDTN